MIIEEPDFKLTPVDESSLLFNLELLHSVKSKDGSKRDEFKIDSYGITLEHAIKKIANYRVSKKYKEDQCISLSTYINDIKDELKKIKDIIC